MKKIILFVLMLTILLNIEKVNASFCCEDPQTGQEKCFSGGQCCNESWYFSCFHFDMWVEPTRGIFTVGKQTNVNLYIHNLCPYPDNYNLTFNITSGNPALIKVDIMGFDYIQDVGPGEIRMVYPSITMLESSATGQVFFNATSEGNSTVQKNATLTVLPSESPVSLPEFDIIGLVFIVLLVGIIYFLNRSEN